MTGLEAMPVETPDDLAAFFSEDGFAVPVRLLLASGERRIPAIFDERYIQLDPRSGAYIASTTPQFLAMTAAVAGLAKRDRVRVPAEDGVLYEVSDLQPDGTGTTTVMLWRT